MLNSLGVICARGGSKGLPNKNIVEILGKPLIWYSIQQALGSKLLTRCLVSTDSPEIANVVEGYASDFVHFLRPAEFATDDAPIDGALIHALEFAEREWSTVYDCVVCLPNSSVLRTSEDIDTCIRILDESGTDSVFSVNVIDHPYELMKSQDRYLVQFNEYYGIYRRQDCTTLYLANGVVRVFRRDFLVENGSIWGGRVVPYIMPQYRSVDVQSKKDLEYVTKVLSV